MIEENLAGIQVGIAIVTGMRQRDRVLLRRRLHLNGWPMIMRVESPEDTGHGLALVRGMLDLRGKGALLAIHRMRGNVFPFTSNGFSFTQNCADGIGCDHHILYYTF